MRITNATSKLVVAALTAGALAATASAAHAADAEQLTAFSVAPSGPSEIAWGPASQPTFAPPLPGSGAHGDVSVSLAVATSPLPPEESFPPEMEHPYPQQLAKRIEVDLPPGLLADPTAAPTCSERQISFDAAKCPAEAQVGVLVFASTSGYAYEDPGNQVGPHPYIQSTVPIYNVARRPDEVVRLGAPVAGGSAVVRITGRVRDEGDHGITAVVSNLPSSITFTRAEVRLWGVPGDPAHDADRASLYEGDNIVGPWSAAAEEAGEKRCLDPLGASYFSCAAQPNVANPGLPFMVNATRCGSAGTARARIEFYDEPGRFYSRTSALADLGSDCAALPFAPSLGASPSSAAAGQPSGYAVDLRVPQNADPSGRTTAHVKDVAVTMPEGVAISPSAASGLAACADDQLGAGTRNAPACPDAAKIGTTTIESPVLDAPLEGSIFLGTQRSNDPTSGEMYRIFLVAQGAGVTIKLKGAIKADPQTGQLTATFENNPQLPFEALKLRFKDGPRAPLVNPTTCGRKTTKATITSWAGQSVSSESSFDITDGCPTGEFSPSFRAGTVSPLAGAFSPFTTTISRSDADQEFKQIGLDLPPGLLGALGKVPVCADAQAAAGTCGPESRLGSTTVLAGSGSQPFSLPGTVSLGGPYKGAPFSLSIAVPAKAGPLDLGMVVVRSPLIVDANQGKVAAPADPLPTIVGGVPLKLRQVTITLDRQGFIFNATNCTPALIGGTLVGTGGAVARPTNRYQADGCANLKLAPSLKIAYTGKNNLDKGRNTGLTADLGQTFGQAGLKKVKVTLPLISALEPKNAEALCTPAQAAARACPEGSIVGRASALTPALHERLSGPVYFLEGTRKTASGKVIPTLPKLWLKLRGDGVDLDLRADTATSRSRLVTTFTSIPDAPIADFKLEIFGGKKGILAAVRNPCTSSRRADVTFDGQNGKRLTRALNISASECGVRASMNASASKVRFGFTGIAAGKVSVSGKGLTSTSRTVRGGDRATVDASLTPAVRRQIASGRTVKLRLTAAFDPKAEGKTTKITKTVTIKGAKKRR